MTCYRLGNIEGSNWLALVFYACLDRCETDTDLSNKSVYEQYAGVGMLLRDVSDIPKTHATDGTELRALLFKHGVPSSVSIPLIHRHLDVNDNEVMVFKRVSAAPFGDVVVMRPGQVGLDNHLHGLNYFVDSDGMLQAYEYTTVENIDMAPYSSFLVEFCAMVYQKGLQAKFGLKLSSNEDQVGATEFEYPHLRSTMIIPRGLPTPETMDDEAIVTEWKGIAPGDPKRMLCIMHT